METEGKAVRLTANGVEIHYEQAGEAGKNVLLLHGWGCSVKHFEQANWASPPATSSPIPSGAVWPCGWPPTSPKRSTAW